MPDAEFRGARQHSAEPASPESCARVLTALRKSDGQALCAACGALAGELSLTEARRAMADLASRGEISVTLDGTCSVCSRRQDVMKR